MEPSLVDALLGLALAYSATYVLYTWLHAGDAGRKRERVQTQAVQGEAPRGSASPAARA